jgi:hypothetical protein
MTKNILIACCCVAYVGVVGVILTTPCAMDNYLSLGLKTFFHINTCTRENAACPSY